MSDRTPAVSDAPQHRAVRPLIFIAVACATLAITVILPILAPLIRALGLTESQGGWMVSTGSALMALSASWWGARSDRLGRKPILLIGFLGLFLSYGLYTLVLWFGLRGVLVGLPLFVALLIGRGIVGVFLPVVPSGAQAYMADITTPDQRASGMALISAANGVGMVVGPALAGVLALFGLIFPMLLATLLPLLAFLVVRAWLPAAPPRPMPPRNMPGLFTPGVRHWLLVALCTMLCTVTLQITAGFYIQDRLALSNTETARALAAALALVGLMLILTQMLQIKVLRWHARRLAMTGALSMGVGLCILLLTQSLPAYTLAYAFLGVGSGMLFPAFMSGASLCVPPQQQGAVAGLLGATQGVGATIAPLASTLLYEHNPAWPFWGLLGLMAIASAAAARAPAAAKTPS